MQIKNLFPGSFGSNCYIIHDQEHAAVIDPSASVSGIMQYLNENRLTLDIIILTHAHFDHMLSLDQLRDATNAPVAVHANDKENFFDGRKNAFYTFFHKDRQFRSPEILLSDGDEIHVGSITLKVIHTPGHTKGSICLTDGKVMFTGDTLFANSYGRCDLYGGDISELRRSLDDLKKLPPDTLIYPGHASSQDLISALNAVKYL